MSEIKLEDTKGFSKYLSERQLKLLEQEPIDFQIDDPI